MSEQNDTKGRCRSELDNALGPYTERVAIADAIDRLAADIAEIKAKVDAISPEDVAHLLESEKAWVRLVEETRDEAIRERDEAREERDEARSEVGRLRVALSDAIRERDQVTRERDGCQEDARMLMANRDRARAECERLHAELIARPEPRGWLTEEERELLALVKEMADDELGVARRTWRCNWPYSRVSLVVKALLTRAGSPPVVVLPAMPHRSRQEAECYRAALDKAGVPWKEVPSE